ncbi:MAG: chemotaxis protein CheC [bacterium]|nr:chemotaxis protein CheC [bacterium]
MVFSGLKSSQLDALMEISNVGVGNAATALSQMLNTSVEIRVPSIKLLEISDVPEHLGGDDKAVLGMFLKMLGDASGNMLFIYPIESAERMVSLLLQQDLKGEELFSELALSALKEVGNILASAYLSALGTMLSINLICSTPSISYDMAGAIIDYTLIELCSSEDKALVVETEFFLRGNEVKGNFFLIPDPGTLEVILAAAGQGK